MNGGSSSLGGPGEGAPETPSEITPYESPPEDSSSQITPKLSSLLSRVCRVPVWQVTLTANTVHQCAATPRIYAAFLL